MFMSKALRRALAARSALRARRVRASGGVATFCSTGHLKEGVLAMQLHKWQQQKWPQQHETTEDPVQYLSVDRSALKEPSSAWTSHSGGETDGNKEKSQENALVHVLRSMIEVKGPLTVAEFMTRAVGHPDYGYYMKKDVFGSQGDFTTAPEISQMFGELIAVWCVATWQQMGTPRDVKIIELGPGRGSLMSDFVRAAKSFPPFYDAIEIHMVDISPGTFVANNEREVMASRSQQLHVLCVLYSFVSHAKDPERDVTVRGN